MPFYQSLVQPIDKTKPTEQLMACNLLAYMAYVRQETVLENAIKLYLGTGNFAWRETNGAVPCNYCITVNDDGTIVAFAGTENLDQFAYYLLTSLNLPQIDINARRMHLGFYNIAEFVLLDLLAFIPPPQRFAPITLIGHSLGGAVAEIIAAWMKVRPGFQVQNVITFGCPAVGDFDFYNLLNGVNVVSVVNQGDVVPYMPPEVGIKWGVGITTLERFAFYHFTPLFPWLLSTYEGQYIQRESNIANLPRAIIAGIWNHIRGAAPDAGSVFHDLIVHHFQINYFMRMFEWMKRSGGSFNEIFFNRMLTQLQVLTAPGQFITEIPQTQFNTLVESLGLQQGLVRQPPPPPDPYLAFYEWCAGTRSDVTIELGLYTVPIPRDQVAIADLIEPKFPGYWRAGNSSWATKSVINNTVAEAQSGLLTWVQTRQTDLEIVRGCFVIMKHDGGQTLIGAQNFRTPVEFGNPGTKLALYVQPVAIYSTYTGSPMAFTATPSGLYSFSYMLTSTVGASAEFTSFNTSLIFPNDLQQLGLPSFGGGAGGARTWWEFRGRDRNIIQEALEALTAIQKRDALALLKNMEADTILNPYDEDLTNALQDVIDQLFFDLIIVHQEP